MGGEGRALILFGKFTDMGRDEGLRASQYFHAETPNSVFAFRPQVPNIPKFLRAC
jgi:hypothetical protein